MTYALITGCIAAALGLAVGGPFVDYLRRKKLGKAISEEGPQTHMVKAGTPTMGGLLIFGVGLTAALLAAVPQDRDVLLPIGVAAAMLAIGFYDDLGTLIDREQREAHARTGMLLKLGGFTIISVAAAWILYDIIDAPRMLVPHFGSYDIGPLFLVVAVFAIVATTSAVGVTDGLDMLAGSTGAVTLGAFGVIALMQDQDALATFCFAIVGALLAFLWFNAYPARVFMGEVGSLPLGAVIAVVALQTGWWLLLPVIGVIFVAEIAADVIQIGYFRLTGGKRIFRMAPLHCHFEQLAVPEVRITTSFLLITVVGAMLGVALVAVD